MKHVIVWMDAGDVRQIPGVVQMEITRERLTLYVGALRDKVTFELSDVYKADVVEHTQQLAHL